MIINSRDILTISLESNTLNKTMNTSFGFDINVDDPNMLYERFTLFLIGAGIIVPSDLTTTNDEDDVEDDNSEDGDILDQPFKDE